MEKVRWLWLWKRGYRGGPEARTASPPPIPSNVNPETREISEARPHSTTWYPTHSAKQQGVPYTRNLKPYTQVAVVSAMILIIGLVVFFGILINGGNFAPDYEPPKIFFQEWK